MDNRLEKTKIIIRCTEKQKDALLQTKIQLQAGTWIELIEKLLNKKKIDPPKAIIQDDVYLLVILTELRCIGNNLNQMTKLANSHRMITPSEIVQLKKLAMAISTLKSKVIKTFVISRGDK